MIEVVEHLIPSELYQSSALASSGSAPRKAKAAYRAIETRLADILARLSLGLYRLAQNDADHIGTANID